MRKALHGEANRYFYTFILAKVCLIVLTQARRNHSFASLFYLRIIVPSSHSRLAMHISRLTG
jgi:hypothetical protein